jgi:type II secretory pathway component PulJ
MRCDLRYKSRLSYTLVEVMVALSCGSILLIGGLDLFMEALQQLRPLLRAQSQ